MELLVLNNVTKEYGSKNSDLVKTALFRVSFNVKKGEFTGIMGPSGAGKSTLLNIMSTIDAPTSGSVLLEDENILNLKGNKLSDFRRDKLGFIFQDSNLLDTLTIKENIILPLTLQKIEPIEAEKRVLTIAKDLGIDDILDKYPVENSGGQRQRAAIARAVVSKPSLILADEPTGALDSNNSNALMSSLTKMQKETDSTILLVTHDPVVASYCNRILFIKDGMLHSEIRKKDSRQEFFSKIISTLSVMEGSENEVFDNCMA